MEKRELSLVAGWEAAESSAAPLINGENTSASTHTHKHTHTYTHTHKALKKPNI